MSAPTPAEPAESIATLRAQIALLHQDYASMRTFVHDVLETKERVLSSMATLQAENKLFRQNNYTLAKVYTRARALASAQTEGIQPRQPLASIH